MNNRYLFRGKRVDNGEWVQGDRLVAECNGYDFTYICQNPCISMRDDIDSSFIEVIPESVGQCTGLKDKNGVLIFEGDVLEVKLNDKP